MVVLLSIDPPLPAHPDLPRIYVELWRPFQSIEIQGTAASQREARMVWSANWTFSATPMYIMLSDIFNGQVPAVYGDNDRVQLDIEVLREHIARAWQGLVFKPYIFQSTLLTGLTGV